MPAEGGPAASRFRPARRSESWAAASSAACWRSPRPGSASAATSTAPTRKARPSTSAPRKTVAAYTDAAALEAFAGAVDVVTYEFENVEVARGRSACARSCRSGRGRRRSRSARTGSTRRRFFATSASATRRVRGGRAIARRLRRRPSRVGLAGDPEDAPLRLRRQGPGRSIQQGRRRRSALFDAIGGAPAILESKFVASSARSRSSPCAALERCDRKLRSCRECPPRRHPAHLDGAGR